MTLCTRATSRRAFARVSAGDAKLSLTTGLSEQQCRRAGRRAHLGEGGVATGTGIALMLLEPEGRPRRVLRRRPLRRVLLQRHRLLRECTQRLSDPHTLNPPIKKLYRS